MTTPGGVPNLPIGALTVQSLAERLQNHTPEAMRTRAKEQMPGIFDASTGGDPLADLTPFGILTGLWATFNSLVANGDPAAIQGPEDLPDLVKTFIEDLPIVGLLVRFMEALGGVAEDVEDFLKPLFDLLKDLWDTFGEAILRPVLEWLGEIWNTLGPAILEPLFEFLGDIWGTFGEVITAIATPILSILNVIFDALGETFEDFLSFISDVITWLFDTFGDALETVLKPIFALLKWVIEQFGTIIETVVKPIIEFVVAVWEQLGANVQAILQPLVDWLKDIFDDGFTGIGDFFYKLGESLLGALPTTPAELIDQLTQLALKIPIIGGLVSQITGLTPADGVSLDLSTIGVWAKDIERKVNETLDKFAQLGEKIAGQIPVSQINLLEQNLLAQGGFLTSSTLDPGDGWTWDSTTNATNTGGSAKVVCTDAEQILYGTQSIKVTATSGTTVNGDRLLLTALVKTTGFTSGTIKLALIPFSGTTRATISGSQTVVVATRSSGSSNFTGLNGTTWTVPAGVTSVQVALIVDCNAGCTVHFDDIRLSKTGFLVQGLVGSLTAGLAGIIDGLLGRNVGTEIVTSLGFGAQSLYDSGKSLFDLRGETQVAVETTNGTLFGDPDGGTEVRKEALPLDDIGAEINPTAGSGALLTRVASNPTGVSSGRNVVPGGFFTDLTVGSADIQCLRTNGTAGTGTGQTDYAGAFKVTNAGWYMVELCCRMNTTFGTGAIAVTPVLFKGSALGSMSPFKVGTDAQFNWIGVVAVAQRYVQNSFIVYLNENEIVQAGLDVSFAGLSSPTAGGESGVGSSSVETYFSISLLNKSFA